MSQSYSGYYEYGTKGIERKTSSVLNGLYSCWELMMIGKW